jgi:anhydro-N-acetylmuramic acid kinase
MNHPYIVSSPPKSTGREIFGHSFVNSIINRYGIKTQEDFYDLIATFTRYTTAAIHFNYEKFFGGKYPIEEIVISGGGANNPAIMWHLKDLFKSIKISSSDRYGVIGDAKEAFAFSIFAALAIWEIPGNVPNATGAKHPVVLGKVTL